MSDAMEKLVTLDILVPGELAVVYPGVDAWTQLDQGGAVAPSGDPAWVSIEHYLVTPGGTPKAMSAIAGAHIDTAQFKFGTSSGFFDGDLDRLASIDSVDWDLGAGDFTIETWLRFSDLTFDGIIAGQWDAAANQMGWLLMWNGTSQLALATSVNGSTNVAFNWTWVPVNNQWYHVALTRQGTSLRLFIDGVQNGAAQTFSGTLFNAATWFNVAGRTDNTAVSLAAWLDELRLSKGIARYTANFTPAVAPFGTDEFTKLLLHFEGANGSTTFTDDSPMPASGVDPGSDPAWMQLEH